MLHIILSLRPSGVEGSAGKIDLILGWFAGVWRPVSKEGTIHEVLGVVGKPKGQAPKPNSQFQL